MREQVASWMRTLRRASSPGPANAISDAAAESPGDDAAAGLPPEGLRFRVGGSNDPKRFREVGQRSVQAIERGLALIDRGVEECERVLDFGCGCGRTLIAFGEQYS